MAANDIVESIICKIKNIHKKNKNFDLKRANNLLKSKINNTLKHKNNNKLKHIVYNQQKSLRQNSRDKKQDYLNECIGAYRKSKEIAAERKKKAKQARDHKLDLWHKYRKTEFFDCKETLETELEIAGNKEKIKENNKKKKFIQEKLRFFNHCCNDKVRLNQDLPFLKDELYQKCDEYKIWSTTTTPKTDHKANEYLSILRKPIGIFDAEPPKKRSRYTYSSQI